MSSRHGNIAAQKKRRYERRNRLPKKCSKKYELIDGNFSWYPVGYCKYHHAYLTVGLCDTHRCLNRECKRFRELEDGECS